MAIYVNGKEITAIHVGKLAITAIYKGSALIWEGVLRIWKSTQVWKGNQIWKY
ncbi:MAG: MFS transporter [Clostridia bacterium]